MNGISYDGISSPGTALMSGAPRSFNVTDATPVTGAIIPPVVTLSDNLETTYTQILSYFDNI